MRLIRSGYRKRLLGCLPSILLTAVICLSPAAPARADFETAVSAYDRGDYEAAQIEFQSLAAAGDERAQSYLDAIRAKLGDETEASGSFMTMLQQSITSMFEGSSSSDSSRGAAGGDGAGSSQPAAVGSPSAGETSEQQGAWQPWSSSAAPDTAPEAYSEISRPSRESIWSTIFHLPGDATVVGLQYVAHLISADNLLRELQFISRHSDEITLSILAGFWWLVILRAVIGFVGLVGRFSRVMTTSTEHKRYG